MSVIVNMYTDYIFLRKTYNCIFITGKGTSLLSGGVESVLVLWQNLSDRQKDFLPRLGSGIEYTSVSPDGTLCCTLHTDNSKQNIFYHLMQNGTQISASLFTSDELT